MKKRLLYFAFLLPWLLVFNSCSKIEPLPDVAQPIVQSYSENETIVVGDTTITIGALKDYEQDSEVIFKLTVTSNSILSNFFVSTTSDSKSNLSRVLRTEPADAIDASGNFIKKLKNVVVYYAYHIHPSVPILSIPILTFNFQNEMQYIGVSSQKFTVIKKGSTQGKILTVINMPWENKYKGGIGAQYYGLDYLLGYPGNWDFIRRRGPFYSIELRNDIRTSSDAITLADKIDITGYIAPSSRTNDPTIVAGQWYFVSPSDTVVLTSTYAGSYIAQITLGIGITTGTNTANITVNGVTKLATYATSTTVTATNFVNANKAAYLAAGMDLTSSGAVLTFRTRNDGVGFGSPTTIIPTANSTLYGNDVFMGDIATSTGGSRLRDIALRQTIRAMAGKLQSNGMSLRKSYFKRLDNSTGPDQVTTSYFDLLTHDNEFDVLLGDVVTGGKTVGGPVALDQVWGFVLNDGRRGLIRTSPTVAHAEDALFGTSSVETVFQPNTNNYVLWCKILVQENK